MTYMVVALKPEAQAFVDKYKLQKSKLGDFTFFSNQETRLILSGLGVENAMFATQTLIDYFDITDDDIYINVGICGADKKHPIGTLLEIGAINYENKTYTLNLELETTLTCLNAEQREEKYEIVDMESFGFYEAVIHSPAIKNIFIFKVVSDHFEPEKVTKDTTKSLIFNAIDSINSVIQTKVF